MTNGKDDDHDDIARNMNNYSTFEHSHNGGMMEPERVKAYLQAACAGLGFDVGEVWWTSDEQGSSTVAAIEHIDSDHEDEMENQLANHGATGTNVNNVKKKLKFVQLYTSKSFESKRSQLVNPPDADGSMRRCNSTENLNKHVLSPRLVEAISRTTQVVWATTKKQEGLTGRSDVRLQTAVGMPVAVDDDGNMCIVVMFSPNTIQSSDEAMEYLQSISQSATSSSIPCLLPVFDPNTSGMKHLPPSNHQIIQPEVNGLPEGITARFVSLDDSDNSHNQICTVERHVEHELHAAPKDTFGIPMLPPVAELGHGNVTPEETIDVFDEASYGVWNTIMDSIMKDDAFDLGGPEQENGNDSLLLDGLVKSDPALRVMLPFKQIISESRKERLDEFCQAFLGMSVFDIADVWVPAGSDGYADCLRHVMSVSSSDRNEKVNEFKATSQHALIKFWSGAVGRAYSSGNPVWSANPTVFADPARVGAFERCKIMTALAVPVFSRKETLPACVVCCYSMVRSGSVPFVLRFLQQALRLLWEGLDNVEPHEAVGDKWHDIAPADLGEMAADVEMQQHFLTKKRPRSQSMAQNDNNRSLSSVGNDSFNDVTFNGEDSQAALIATQLESIQLPSGETITVPLQLIEDVPERPRADFCIPTLQQHVNEAFRSISNAVPFDSHVSTNSSGTKRAHVAGVATTPPPHSASPAPNPPPPLAPLMHPSPTSGVMGRPLRMPRAFPTQVVTSSTASPSTPQAVKTSSPVVSHYLQPIQQQQFQQQQQPGQQQQQQQFQQQQQQQPVQQQQQQQPVQQQQQQQPVQQQQQQQPVQQQQQQLFVQRPVTQSLQQPPTPPISMRPVPVISIAQNQQHQVPNHILQTDISTQNTAFVVPMVSQGYLHTYNDMQFCQPVNGMAHDMLDSMGMMRELSNGELSDENCSKTCRIQGCDLPTISRRPYCEKHSGPRLCEHNGCNKCAQGSTRFCIAHGGGRRCTFPGCDKGARDKFFCAAHGGGKRCKHNGCSKSAVGGSSLCTAHGGGRRCSIDGCDKSAQSSTKFCVKHGGGKKCLQEGCEKVARGRTPFCAAHGGGVRCKLEGCNRVAIGKMQLCRAHGGSSSRSKKNGDDDSGNTSPVSLEPYQHENGPEFSMNFDITTV